MARHPTGVVSPQSRLVETIRAKDLTAALRALVRDHGPDAVIDRIVVEDGRLVASFTRVPGGRRVL